jgi:hypothetical protein
MFRCEECGRVTQPREKQHRVVTGTRERVYAGRDDVGAGRGWEIVSEARVCGGCVMASAGRAVRDSLVRVAREAQPLTAPMPAGAEFFGALGDVHPRTGRASG